MEAKEMAHSAEAAASDNGVGSVRTYPISFVPPKWANQAGNIGAACPAIVGRALAGFAILLNRYTGEERMLLEMRVVRASGADVVSSVNVTLLPGMALAGVVSAVRDAVNAVPADQWQGAEVRIAVPPALCNSLASMSAAKDDDRVLQLRMSMIAGEIAGKEGVRGNIEYRQESFESWFIAQMARHLAVVLDAIATNVEASVAEVELLTDDERRQMLELWNATSMPNSELAIAELFVEQVKKTPDRVAVACGTEELTYEELNRAANRLAHYLRKRGVGPDVCVGFCFENSIAAVVSVLGILKAGGLYVPLDHSHPMARLREIVEHARLKIVLTDSKLRHSVPSADVLLIDVDDAAEAIAQESEAGVGSGCTAASAAYVIYTSGSTGQPKGVIGIHRSVINGLHETLFDREDSYEVSCLNGSLNVGFQVLGLFLPLLSGIPLVVFSSVEYRDPLLLADVVGRYKVTSLVLPTPSLRQLLSLGARASSRLETLRTVMVGGSLVTPDLVEAFSRTLPHTRLNKAYGSTEIGGIATKGPARTGNSVGKPIANTSIYVLDKHNNPVPIGVTGELYVAGPHLARGYLNQPDLTAERFLKNGLANRPDERLYRTGDLARYRRNGEVEFLGRLDDQVKIRGFRVHLGEVETVLNGHFGVREVAVWVRELDGQQRLVAYVAPEPSVSLSVTELRDFVGKRLPEPMIPSAFVFLERLPMTISGKVDRAALPEPTPLRPALAVQYEPPQNAVEAFLAETWGELLKLNPVGIHDDFLDLGGDSLFAVQITSRVWERYGLELPIELIFERRTVSMLAAEIVAATSISQTL